MASRAGTIVKTRESILIVVNNYLNTARGIDDLHKEGDYSDLEDIIDDQLECAIKIFEEEFK